MITEIRTPAIGERGSGRTSRMVIEAVHFLAKTNNRLIIAAKTRAIAESIMNDILYMVPDGFRHRIACLSADSIEKYCMGAAMKGTQVLIDHSYMDDLYQRAYDTARSRVWEADFQGAEIKIY